MTSYAGRSRHPQRLTTSEEIISNLVAKYAHLRTKEIQRMGRQLDALAEPSENDLWVADELAEVYAVRKRHRVPTKSKRRKESSYLKFIVAASLLVGLLWVVGKTSLEQDGSDESADRDTEMQWVTSDRLNRRSCPSTRCGVVGQLFFREGVTIHERKGGWARITDYYDASCVNGRSEYVDTGKSACTAENGIVDGRFAEWVSVRFLSDQQPPDPATGATGVAALVGQSDDFRKYRAAFVAAAETLIRQRRCSEEDFRSMGGWVKSSTHRNKPIYFTYCGGATVEYRLYLNAKTGEVFK